MNQPKPPTGFARLLWRMPIWLFRLNLGWLFGNRMMLLNHIGRKSGKIRQVVLEVARYDKATDHYYVCSGFGKQSDWYRNLAEHPEVSIIVGRRTIDVTANLLSAEASADELARYATTHPKLAQALLRVIGHDVPETIEGYRNLAHESLPFVEFIPRKENT